MPGLFLTLQTNLNNFEEYHKKGLTPIEKECKNENDRVASPEHAPIYFFRIQSTLVISTSVISNNRLSRRENLIYVST